MNNVKTFCSSGLHAQKIEKKFSYFCSRCSEMVLDNDHYCSNCGAHLEDSLIGTSNGTKVDSNTAN